MQYQNVQTHLTHSMSLCCCLENVFLKPFSMNELIIIT